MGRRLGNKYKGKMKVEKSPEELAKEAEVKKLQEETMQRMAEQQASMLAMGNVDAEKAAKFEERRQKMMAMMMGGRTGKKKKWFVYWTIGARINLKERMVMQREMAWRQACGGCDDATCPGGCAAFKRLQKQAFEMPFDIFRKSSKGFYSTEGKSKLSRTQAAFSTTSLPSLSTGFQQATTEDAAKAKVKVWLEGGAIENMAHSATGGRVLVNRETGRMAWPVMRMQVGPLDELALTLSRFVSTTSAMNDTAPPPRVGRKIRQLAAPGGNMENTSVL